MAIQDVLQTLPWEIIRTNVNLLEPTAQLGALQSLEEVTELMLVHVLAVVVDGRPEQIQSPHLVPLGLWDCEVVAELTNLSVYYVQVLGVSAVGKDSLEILLTEVEAVNEDLLGGGDQQAGQEVIEPFHGHGAVPVQVQHSDLPVVGLVHDVLDLTDLCASQLVHSND